MKSPLAGGRRQRFAASDPNRGVLTSSGLLTSYVRPADAALCSLWRAQTVFTCLYLHDECAHVRSDCPTFCLLPQRDTPTPQREDRLSPSSRCICTDWILADPDPSGIAFVLLCGVCSSTFPNRCPPPPSPLPCRWGPPLKTEWGLS